MHHSGKKTDLSREDLLVVGAEDNYVRPGDRIQSLALKSAARDLFFASTRALQPWHALAHAPNPLITEAQAPADPQRHQQGELFISPDVMALVLLEFIQRQQPNPKYDTRSIYLLSSQQFSELNSEHELIRLLIRLKEQLQLGQNAKIVWYRGPHAFFIYFERKERGDYFYLFDSERQSSELAQYFKDAFKDDTVENFKENLQVDFYSCATICFKVLRLFCKLDFLKLSLEKDRAKVEEQLFKYAQRKVEGKTILRHGSSMQLEEYQREFLVDGKYNASHLLAKYSYFLRANYLKSIVSKEKIGALRALLSYPKGPSWIQAFFKFKRVDLFEVPAGLDLEKYLKAKQELEKFNDQDREFFSKILKVLFEDERSAIQYCEMVLKSLPASEQPLHDLLILVPADVLEIRDEKKIKKLHQYFGLSYGGFAQFLLAYAVRIANSKEKQLDILVYKLVIRAEKYKRARENPEAAALFMHHGLSESVFNSYLLLKPAEDLPFKTRLLRENYEIRFIDKRDPLAALLGNLTGCCQRLDGLARTAVEYGITHPWGGFIGMFNPQGQLTAQAFVYLAESSISMRIRQQEASQLILLIVDSIEVSHADHMSQKRKDYLGQLWLDFFALLLREHPNLDGLAVGKVNHGLFAAKSPRCNMYFPSFYLGDYGRFRPDRLFASVLPAESGRSCSVSNVYTDFGDPEISLVNVNPKNFPKVLGFFMGQIRRAYQEQADSLSGSLKKLLSFARFKEFRYEAGEERDAVRRLIEVGFRNPWPLCLTTDPAGDFFEQDSVKIYLLFLKLLSHYYFSGEGFELTPVHLQELETLFAKTEKSWRIDGLLTNKKELTFLLNSVTAYLGTEHEALAIKIFYRVYESAFCSQAWFIFSDQEFKQYSALFTALEQCLDPKAKAFIARDSSGCEILVSQLRVKRTHLDKLFARMALMQNAADLKAYVQPISAGASIFSEDSSVHEACQLLERFERACTREYGLCELAEELCKEFRAKHEKEKGLSSSIFRAR